MKILVMAASAVLLMAGTGLAAEQTFNGKISDSICNMKHEAATENEPAPPDAECTLACVKGGSKFVLVVGDTIYQIANQDNPDLKTHAGHTVKLTGELKGDTITVSAIAMP